jgi:EmrB/QacA subfamily drug resistance transporter
MSAVRTAAPRTSGHGSRERSPWLVLAVLCIGLFMILLDGTIVNIAIPHIMRGFSTGLSNVEWVMNAYVLAFAVTLVIFGRFGDLYGRRRLFVLGMIVFTAASIACGLAPGIHWLIGFRVLQGLGGAAMMPQTLSIVAGVFPPGKRGAAMGVWGGVSGLATALGPSLGGLIVDAASWRWIFLINVPIGLLGALLALRVVPESRNPGAVETLDLLGVGILSGALLCLTFALIEGQSLGWTSAAILGLFGASVALLVVFALHERRLHQPLIDFTLFRQIDFLAGNMTGLLLSAAMMGVFFTIPIFLQTVLGFSALRAGLAMSPMSVVIMVAAPLAGTLSDKLGSKWIVALGMFLLAFGIAWMAGLTPWQDKLSPATTTWSLLIPFVIAGIGIGFAVAPVTTAVMATAPPERVGNASGVLSTMRQVGSLMGIAVLGAVLQNQIAANVRAGLETLQGIPDQVRAGILKGVEEGGMQMGAGSASGLPAAAQQAMEKLFLTWFTDAINTTFIVGVVLALLGGFCALLLRKRPRAAEREVGHAAARGAAMEGAATAGGPHEE